MIYQTLKPSVPGSADYVSLTLYLQEYTEKIGIEKRPLVLICPGGAYGWTSDREAEPLAFAFAGMGCHAAVLRYTTAPDAQFPTALSELALSVKTIRNNASKWHVDPDKIIVLGASAGGHLVASLGCFWNRSFLCSIGTPEEIKPDGLILCYPVITMGEFTHEGSRDNLVGNLKDAQAFGGNDIIDFLSLEKQVTSDVPPCFIWATYEDGAVPIENTLYFVGALRKAGISAELHIFPHGGHGLSLANGLSASPDGGLKEYQPEAAEWIHLVKNWLKADFPLTYTYM